MTGRKDYKVPGGKLLRVELELERGIVIRAAVRGDFFAHPEEAFEEAEGGLSGLPVEGLEAAALALFGKAPLRVFGASPADIASALMAAAHEAQADR
jgi:lipoate---protein ligase